MKAIISHKLKLTTENSRFLEVVNLYKRAANWLSNIIYSNKNIKLNSNKLQKEFYGTIRQNFKLPSQVTCALFKHVCSTYKSMKSNKEWSLAIYKKNTVPLGWKRDFNITQNKLTVWGEPSIYLCRKIPGGKWKDSKLKLIKGAWYLVLAIEIDVPEPKTSGTIVGVDAGQKNLLTAVDKTSNKTLYISGNALNHRRLCIRQVKAKVASVGSPSSKRLLKRLSGREKAVTQELLHIASKRLVTFAESVGARTIVMEDLTGIRSSKKPTHHKQRARNHRWPFAQCQFYIAYKAMAKGITIEYVSPRDTSRQCRSCGHTEEANRDGLKFLCRSCGMQDNADRNGACNIASRSLLFWRNSGTERAVSQAAYSNNEEHQVQLVTIPITGWGT